MSTLPLVLVFLLLLAIHQRNGLVFVLAFFAGLFLDILRLQALGETSLFLLGFLFLVLLYERKYEIASGPFVLLASFCGSAVFCLFFGLQNVLLQATTCAGIATAIFLVENVKHKTQNTKLQFKT